MIRLMKINYRRRFLNKLIEIDETPSLLDAIYWIAESWKEVKSEHIVNCFRKAGYATGTSEIQEPLIEAMGMLQSLLQTLARTRSTQELDASEVVTFDDVFKLWKISLDQSGRMICSERISTIFRKNL